MAEQWYYLKPIIVKIFIQGIKLMEIQEVFKNT
jgi:hypothetical protein